MSRWFLALLLVSVATAHGQAQSSSQHRQPPPEKGLQKERPKDPEPKEAVPPEEDKALATEEYAFNPLQARKELQTGNYYFKKGSYRAAAGRFREATKWNDGYAEAWLRLGEAEEKLKDGKAARQAYTKYLEIAVDARNAGDIRKKLEKLK
jgi:tetratricopeptide (TPR) repeat protein